MKVGLCSPSMTGFLGVKEGGTSVPPAHMRSHIYTFRSSRDRGHVLLPGGCGTLFFFAESRV